MTTEPNTSTVDQRNHSRDLDFDISFYNDIDTAGFFAAVYDYIDENKPDELCRRQMKAWALNWENQSHRQEQQQRQLSIAAAATTTTTSFNNTALTTATPPCWWWSKLPSSLVDREQQHNDHPHHEEGPSKRFSALGGVLTWRGQYMTVYLETICCWKTLSGGTSAVAHAHKQGGGDNRQTADNSRNFSTKSGALFFACRAWGEFVSFSPSSENNHNRDSVITTSHTSIIDRSKDKPVEDRHDKDQKQQRMIHKKMIQRLQQDSYLSTFVNASNNPLDVCEASILVGKAAATAGAGDATAVAITTNQENDTINTPATTSSCVDRLEERVHWNESTVETIRRAVFSQAESTLDVLELILSFPFLPSKVAKTDSSNSTENKEDANMSSTEDDANISATAARPAKHEATEALPFLARRAKLRLLEDAMYDACEQEEEEEIIEDLHISKKLKT
ncbi:hypothetical protein ACA910_002342 [Epithemia clementina (nom. ined.)]